MSGQVLDGALVVKVAAADVPRQTHDRVSEIYCAALAEVGYDADPEWSDEDHQYLHANDIPVALRVRAAVLAFDATGIEYELTSASSQEQVS